MQRSYFYSRQWPYRVIHIRAGIGAASLAALVPAFSVFMHFYFGRKGGEFGMAGDMDPSEVKKQIGARIKSIRKDCGMSQYELAELAGLSITYISDIEKGKRDAKETTLSRIAEVLQVPLSAIQPDSLDKFLPFRPDIMELVNLLISMDPEESEETVGYLLNHARYVKKNSELRLHQKFR